VVDWDGLENRCGCKVTVGSNPTLSAIILDRHRPISRISWIDRRGDRVVEGARLEIVCSVYSATVGSNPTLSAM
jgi:hypothetical protein